MIKVINDSCITGNRGAMEKLQKLTDTIQAIASELLCIEVCKLHS